MYETCGDWNLENKHIKNSWRAAGETEEEVRRVEFEAMKYSVKKAVCVFSERLVSSLDLKLFANVKCQFSANAHLICAEGWSWTHRPALICLLEADMPRSLNWRSSSITGWTAGIHPSWWWRPDNKSSDRIFDACYTDDTHTDAGLLSRLWHFSKKGQQQVRPLFLMCVRLHQRRRLYIYL